jgi:hypothetical protein
MDPMKQMIQQKLIANVIMDKCARSGSLIFRDSWCTQERVIRFTTPFWQNLLGEGAVMYEAENKPDSFAVHCVCKLNRKDPTAAKVRAVLGVADSDIWQSWDITAMDPNAIFDAFDTLISKTIPSFEKDLEAKLQQNLVEGEQTTTTTTKYERNPQARAACLAYHGYTCKICGMSFEKIYGPEFKNIIEVHHIVPLHQIGESYVVDPIRDLIPVCPNCHAAIHSKSGNKLLLSK